MKPNYPNKASEVLFYQFTSGNTLYEVKLQIQTQIQSKIILNDLSFQYSISRGQDVDGLARFQVQKAEYIINKKPANTKLEELAIQCSSCYYPVEILMATNGEIVGIANHSEIQNRWFSRAPKIRSYFTGEVVDRYLDGVENKVTNESKFSEIISRDFLLNLFFLPYFYDENETQSVCYKKLFPQQFVFKLQQQKKTNEHNELKINQSGIIEESRSYSDIVLNRENIDHQSPKNPVSGEINNQFIIDKSRLLTKIHSKTVINLTPNVQKTYTYFITRKHQSNE